MKKTNKETNSPKIGNDKIKLFEIIFSSTILLLAIIGIIFASIAVHKRQFILNDDVDTAITSLVIGIAAIFLITYLAFETFFTERVYDIELTVRFFLLVVVVIGVIVSLGMGTVAFIATLEN